MTEKEIMCHAQHSKYRVRWRHRHRITALSGARRRHVNDSNRASRGRQRVRHGRRRKCAGDNMALAAIEHLDLKCRRSPQGNNAEAEL